VNRYQASYIVLDGSGEGSTISFPAKNFQEAAEMCTDSVKLVHEIMYENFDVIPGFEIQILELSHEVIYIDDDNCPVCKEEKDNG